QSAGNPSSSSTSSSAKGKSNKTSSSSSTPSSSTPSSSSAPPRPYADKLDANGKLKPEERARRIKENLCMVCGSAEHKAFDCPKTRHRARFASAGQPATDSSAGKA